MRVELQKQGWARETLDSIISSSVLGTGVKKQGNLGWMWLPLTEDKDSGEEEVWGRNEEVNLMCSWDNQTTMERNHVSSPRLGLSVKGTSLP